MRAAFGLALAIALIGAPACRPARQAAAPEAAPGQPPRLAATVHMGDPKMAGQLVSGFYDIEGGGWRWTGKQFTVELGTPYGAAQRGGVLDFHLTVPPVVIAKAKSVRLEATVDGNGLPSETYTRPGEYVFQRDIPSPLLGRDSVRVTFTLDKTIQPGGGDLRDLGVVAASVGLKSK